MVSSGKKLKYPIVEEFLEEVLSTFWDLLIESGEIDVDEDVINKITEEVKNGVLNNCPLYVFVRENKKSLEVFRFATRKPMTEADFYPHMYKKDLRIYCAKKEIKRRRRSKKYEKWIDWIRSGDFDSLRDDLKKEFCSCFSVSVFANLREAKSQFSKIRRAKLIVKGQIVQERDGFLYSKALNDKSSHRDWYPWEGVDELKIFQEVVFERQEKGKTV